MREGRLVTASCTTGWVDWIHRELWLCEDGLLLVRLDLAATRAHRMGPTVTSPPRTRVVADEELGGTWIAAEEIAGSDGRRGRTSDRLNLELRDGSRRKLLWLKADRADVPLLAALDAWGVAPASLGAFGREG
jgi:hypothetical protein